MSFNISLLKISVNFTEENNYEGGSPIMNISNDI